MSYKSIDILQNSLATTVFSSKKDAKKATGRALGTIVEIIAYYLLREWGLTHNIQIETKLPEFGNPEITHNVEFTLHRVNGHASCKPATPLSYNSVRRMFGINPIESKSGTFIDRRGVVKNSAIIGADGSEIFSCNLVDDDIVMSVLQKEASAMFECKRVGVEEGQKKGPQTIEKAKQGAYVAMKSSSLQKIRDSSGTLYAVYFKQGCLCTEIYEKALSECLDTGEPTGFLLTIGVVSNHGNWFTSKDMNKELKVLAQSYDRLLFLTDEGLSAFIDKTILNPEPSSMPIRKAFMDSYSEGKKSNSFTKSRISREAHKALTVFFKENVLAVESWFNVISPDGMTIEEIKRQLHRLLKL